VNAAVTDQLSNRLQAILTTGTQRMELGMETEAGGPTRRSNRAQNRNNIRADEERLRVKQQELAKLKELERVNPQPRLPKAMEKRPIGPPQSQDVPRRRASPGRSRPDRPTLGVDRDFDTPDEPENRLTAKEIARVELDGRTYVQALRDDGVDVDDLKVMMSDIVELTEYTKDGTVTNDCSGSTENMRRGDVLFAVESVRTKLKLLDWPLNALGLARFEDLCAFEAIIFLASPNALVQSCLSIGRAKLRQQWGQRELCGWLDTVLLCVRPMNTRPRIVSGLFLTSCNRSHLDIVGQSGYAALGNNISQAFSNAITLSKMYMFVEELLLANSYSGGILGTMKTTFEKQNSAVCIQIEQDGALGYVWAAMLHFLVTGRDIDPSVGFTVSKGGPERYKKYMVGGNATGEYIWNVFILAQNAWWVDTFLLTTTLNLINEENAREYYNASTYQRLTATTNVRSCLSVNDAERYFAFSKTSSAMKVVWAKTWAITVCSGSALATVSGAAIRTAATVTYYTSLAVSSSAALFGAAPVTTTVVGGAAAVTFMNRLRNWSPDVANYVQGLGQDVANAGAEATVDAATLAAQAAETAAREGVRNAAGYTARTSTARVNSAAMAAATMVGANARSVPQFDARQAAAAAQNAVDGNEGFFAAAATFFTGIFTYTTINGVRRVPAAAIVIGNRLNNRYNPVARGTRGGASTGGME